MISKSDHQSASRVWLTLRIDQTSKMLGCFEKLIACDNESRDHRSRKRGRGNEGHCAAQTRVLFGGHNVNLSCATEVSQSSFAQGAAHDRFDQTPRRSDFAADVDPRGVY